jgi:hypothetical protein
MAEIVALYQRLKPLTEIRRQSVDGPLFTTGKGEALRITMSVKHCPKYAAGRVVFNVRARNVSNGKMFLGENGRYEQVVCRNEHSKCKS